MNHILVLSPLAILLLFPLLFCSTGGVSNSEIVNFNQAPARRSLLSHSDGHNTALVAGLDGTVSLLDVDSRSVIWSFASGSPIYSSYQAPINSDDENKNTSVLGGSFFIDCGDDWKLFAKTRHGKANLDMTAADFLGVTPHVTEDGGVVLGSEKSTAFWVDAKTGRLIRGYYSSPDGQPTPSSNAKPLAKWENSGLVDQKPDELQLYITRTDYLLTSVAPKSGKVLWNVTVSDIGAALLCQENQNPTSGPPLSDGNVLPSEAGVNFKMPLPCQSKAAVTRLRTSNLLDYLNSFALQPKIEKYQKHNRKIPRETEHLLPAVAQNLETPGLQELKEPDYRGVSKHTAFSVAFVFFFVVFVIYRFKKLTKQLDALNAKAASSKRRKLRKSGKNGGYDYENAEINSEEKSRLNFNDLIEGETEGRSIGKLFVSTKEIAKGSNGTIVLEGIYEGRKVAVKRLVKAHHDVAFKEIQNLIASDQHPNIVRWYGVEYDQDFVYLSLERCTCSLYDLIHMYSESFQKLACTEGQAVQAMADYRGHLCSMKGFMQDTNLWKANGYPSPILLKLMRDVVSGLVHLHELGIIHRDLKPQNVLIVKERSLCGKLSDMGISKRLVGDMSSLGHHATGSGSSGWQAPEQLLLGRQTRAVDLFSLGCVLFFCITCGKHPFGDHLERDVNVAKNKVDLFLVEHIPEAVDLLCQLLNPHAVLRPKATEVLQHPLFWDSETRLSFLRDTSDRVELEDREADSGILIALESKAPVALGGKWDEKMEPAFITNIGRYRRYKYSGVRDLLRVMRNKLNHYRELPKEIQELLGPVPEGFDEYFASRFPKLLIEVYKVMHSYCKEEEWFRKYLNCNQMQ